MLYWLKIFFLDLFTDEDLDNYLKSHPSQESTSTHGNINNVITNELSFSLNPLSLWVENLLTIF